MSEIKNPIAQLDPKAIDQMVETFTAMGKAMREAVEELLKEREWNHPSETDLLVQLQSADSKVSVILPTYEEAVEGTALEQDEPDSFVAPFKSKGTSVMDHDGGITPLTNEEDVARQNDYEADRFGVPLDWNVAMAMYRVVPTNRYLNVRRDLNESNVVKDMFEKQATNWGAELRTLYGLLDCVENNKAIDALKQLLAERDDLLKRVDYATQHKDETIEVNAKLGQENIAVHQKAQRLQVAYDTAKEDLANVKKANDELREANRAQDAAGAELRAANDELAKANNHQADTIQELSEDKANHDSLRGEVDRVKRVNANQAEQLIQVKKGNEELAAANNRQAKVIEELRKDRDETLSELAKTKDRVEDLRAMLPSTNPVSTRPLAVDEQYNKRVIKDAPQA